MMMKIITEIKTKEKGSREVKFTMRYSEVKDSIEKI